MTHMAYCTVKCVLSGVPFPVNQCSTFLRFTEEKVTLMGLGGEVETEEEDVKGRERYEVRVWLYKDLVEMISLSGKAG